MAADIKHLVVLMLENRSLDCMLGRLYPDDARFDGLTGTETNVWHKPGGLPEIIPVWTDPTLTAAALCIPDPDPGEGFADIHMQINGMGSNAGPAMGGFVDNYMERPVTSPAPARNPAAVMHHFTPDLVPVISQLARAFGVSDRWHASAPCQTWPNRFFAHCGTANGYVNNAPSHFPYTAPTVFHRLSAVKQSWRVYFHDIPQSATLAGLWTGMFTHFRGFDEDFARDAATGNLPAYSFIEPRYFPDTLLGRVPNDEHPPHNVADGEALIAAVYNAVRAGPGWRNTLLIITYDEHGGCYDHVVPPPATPPGGPYPDGFAFDSFGVRVPAVIISPYVGAGSILRPPGPMPFDHTTIIATLRRLFGFAPLTARDAAAPDLMAVLGPTPDNDGPAAITAPARSPTPAQVTAAAARPPNDLQRGLTSAAVQLPTFGANIGAHIQHLFSVTNLAPDHATAGAAAAHATARMKAFLGKS
jgi:phospholipase C